MRPETPGIAPHMTTDADIFVIGAGPAGLTTAYCLTKETPSVIVIEKDPLYVGGISRTVRHGNFLFDIGGHRFFSKAREVVDLWHEILPDDFITRPRLSRIYYGGKFYSYPLSAFQALRNLGRAETLVRAQAKSRCGRRRCREDADRDLPISAQGARHDVGSRCRQGYGARRPNSDGSRAGRTRL